MTSVPKDASAEGTPAPMNEFSVPKDTNAEGTPAPKSPLGESSKSSIPKDVYTEGTHASPVGKVHSFVHEIDPDLVPDDVNLEGFVSNSVGIKGNPSLVGSSMHNSKQGYSAPKKPFSLMLSMLPAQN